VVFADRGDGTGLRTSVAFGFLRHEAHFVADGELVEPAIGHAVAVEIDFGAVTGPDEPAVLVGEQARDPTVVRYRMQLHVAAALTDIIFEQPSDRIERIAHRDMSVLMCVIGHRVAADDDLPARDPEVDTDMEQVALLPPRVPAFDNDPARDDPIEEAVKLFGATPDTRSDCF
jgi:hypothetical protein